MDPPLRAVALVAIGLLAAALAVGLLSHAGLPKASLSVAGEGPIRLPLPALILILLSFGLAWCYALSAGVYTHPILRLVLLSAFTLAMLDQGTLFAPALENKRAALLAVALGAVWLIVMGEALPVWADRPRVTRRAVPAVFVLTAVVQVLAWWSSRASHVPGVFALEFLFDLTVFAIVASVYLCSAGGEFAQVASVICGSVAERLEGRKPWLVLGAAAALAAVLLVRAVDGAPSGFAADAALGVAAGAAVVLVSRRRPRGPGDGRMPSWTALLAGAAVAGALMIAVGLSQPDGGAGTTDWKLPPPTLVYGHPTAPRFSVAYPPGWQLEPQVSPAGLSVFQFSGESAGVQSVADVFAFRRSRPGSAPVTAAQALGLVRRTETLPFRRADVTVTPTADPYRYSLAIGNGTRVVIRGRAGVFWTTGYVWVVQVVANYVWWPAMTAVGDYLVNSWRPDGSARPVDLSPPVPVRTPTGYYALIGLATTVLLALVLLVAPLPARIAVVARCVCIAMLLVGLVDLREGVALLAGHAVAGVPHLNLRAVEFVAALALGAAIALGLRPGRPREQAMRRVTRFGVLGGTILLLSFLFNLYAGAAAGALTVTEVAFLLAAFLWDVALSGDVTNGDGRWVRRPARVLLYMSYLLAASAATLYFASSRSLGTLRIEDSFGPEAQVALSVFFVGFAYAIVTCVDRYTARADERPAPARPATSETAPAESVAALGAAVPS